MRKWGVEKVGGISPVLWCTCCYGLHVLGSGNTWAELF